MSSATETLCGQAFGAGQYHMMGTYLQRSWIIGFVTATILLPLFIFTEPIFRLLGEEKSIAVESTDISRWFIPILYLGVFLMTMQMYLQAQLKNMVVGWVSWLFVSKLNLGLPGAMGSLVISSWLTPFGLFAYIFGGWCPLSWKGFSKAAFFDLWPLVTLSVSSGIMLWNMVDNLEERLLGTEEEDRSDLKWRVWVESKKIWRVAAPGIIARATSFGLLVVTQSFIGHISELDLAACALVQTLIARFANGIIIGMSSATETLCGQAFGAGQYHMMGIYLQRSWIIGFITATILLPLFIFTEPIFRLLGEEKTIAVESKDISRWFIPFLYLAVFYMTMQMYLQAQLKNMIVAWFSAGPFIFHLIVSWLVVSKLNLGIPGAMGSLVISTWLMPFGLFVYIFGGWCPLSWKGFSKAAFSDLWPLVKLSVASGIMICLEFWYNSILVLIAGYMSDAEIAISAFSICLNISGWEFMMCLGFLGAACVRVANELGRGDAKAVKFSIKVILSTSVILGLVFFILCLLFGHNIGYLFTSNDEVAETIAELSVLLAFTMLFNSIQPVLSGVAVGAGLQGTVAIINLCCYYVIGIPIGCLLAYVADLEVKGIWIGMLSGVGVQILALALMVWRTDWDLQVNEASERVGRWFLKPSEEPDESLNHA